MVSTSTLRTLSFPGILFNLFSKNLFDFSLGENAAATSRFAHAGVEASGGEGRADRHSCSVDGPLSDQLFFAYFPLSFLSLELFWSWAGRNGFHFHCSLLLCTFLLAACLPTFSYSICTILPAFYFLEIIQILALVMPFLPLEVAINVFCS